MTRNHTYGILAYNSANIGDEVQTIAQMRFIPEVEKHVFREIINKFEPKDKKKVKLITNAWWMKDPKKFPPSKWIEPLLISMHIRPAIKKDFFNKKTNKYLIENGPVGCRDMQTYELLKSQNIPAYFSGCLTLTLQRNPLIKREDYILCIDTRPGVADEIRKRTNRPVYEVNRHLSPYYTFEKRLEVAKLMIRLYHSAHVVVSPCLHAILPSLALGTPVLRMRDDGYEQGGRFTGYEDFFNVCTLKEFFENKDIYNFENPPANPNNHIEMRNDLIKRCSEFTGYDNDAPCIDETINPLVEMIKLSNYKYEHIKEILYWAKPRDLLRAWFKKKFLGITKYDIANKKR